MNGSPAIRTHENGSGPYDIRAVDLLYPLMVHVAFDELEPHYAFPVKVNASEGKMEKYQNRFSGPSDVGTKPHFHTLFLFWCHTDIEEAHSLTL